MGLAPSGESAGSGPVGPDPSQPHRGPSICFLLRLKTYGREPGGSAGGRLSRPLVTSALAWPPCCHGVGWSRLQDSARPNPGAEAGRRPAPARKANGEGGGAKQRDCGGAENLRGFAMAKSANVRIRGQCNNANNALLNEFKMNRESV
jgi:hypothetical protein